MESSKNTKTPVDGKRRQAVLWVARKFEVSTEYVYGAINGTHLSGRAPDIKQAYKKKYKELEAVLAD